MPLMTFRRQCKLESALTDAARAADIVTEWMAHAVGFENREPPKLTKATATNIYWAMNTVAHLIQEADRIFHEPEEQIAP